MFEFTALAVDMHRRVIDAHEKSLEATRKSLKGADAAIAMHKAMTDAARAHVDIWDRWMALWSPRK